MKQINPEIYIPNLAENKNKNSTHFHNKTNKKFCLQKKKMELLNLQKIRQVVTTQIQTNKEQKSYNFG